MICLTEIKPTEWNGMPEFHIFREWEYSLGFSKGMEDPWIP